MFVAKRDERHSRAFPSPGRKDPEGKEGRKEGRRNADFVTSSNSHSGVGTPTPARYDEIEQQKATEEAAEEATEEEKEEKK